MESRSRNSVIRALYGDIHTLYHHKYDDIKRTTRLNGAAHCGCFCVSSQVGLRGPANDVSRRRVDPTSVVGHVTDVHKIRGNVRFQCNSGHDNALDIPIAAGRLSLPYVRAVRPFSTVCSRPAEIAGALSI